MWPRGRDTPATSRDSLARASVSDGAVLPFSGLSRWMVVPLPRHTAMWWIQPTEDCSVEKPTRRSGRALEGLDATVCTKPLRR